ncbi:putative 4-phosphopantetheinyl transferase EntD, partial [Escherichia coli 2861200]
MGKNDVNQIADNVRVVHAGCGVNALSSLQNCAKSMDCTASVGLISVAHQ